MKKSIDQNIVRRGIALAVPVILEVLAKGCKASDLDSIRAYLPKYKLSGVDPTSINVYFTPVNTKDTGKRRVYMNGNGYFIRYLTRKSVRAVFADLKESFGDKISEKTFYGCFANRWAIMKGFGYRSLDSFDDFVNALAFIESNVSKSNHPPCGFMKFTCVEDMLDHGNIQDFRPDFMQPGSRSVSMRLDGYELTLPKIEEVKS